MCYFQFYIPFAIQLLQLIIISILEGGNLACSINNYVIFSVRIVEKVNIELALETHM